MALAKIVYASMTGNTEEIADIVAKKLDKEPLSYCLPAAQRQN